jgi:hypothetical protein
MALDAQITDMSTGEIDRELSAEMSPEHHGALFGCGEVSPDRFPLLCRLRDYYADAHFDHRELEAFISELEQASALFPAEHSVKKFLGPFHSLCCLAFCRGRGVDLYAD